MTVEVDDRRYPYTRNGVATVYPGPRVWSADQIEVFEDDVLVDPANYEVSGLGLENSTITMDDAGTNGVALLIQRTVPIEQATRFTNQGAFLPEIHEDAFDYGAMIDQQLDDKIDDTREDLDEQMVALEADLAAQISYWLSIYGQGLGNFLQAGTGAVTRLAQDKMRDIVSVKDFGAVGDGITDDTAAIQLAVTAQQGGALFFPNGSYKNTAYPTGIDGVHMTGSPRVTFVGTALPLFMNVFTGNRELCLVAGVVRYYTSGASGAGWYFIADQGGNHEPVLVGPVTASGSSSVILEMNVSDFGLDLDEWTPAGFVCGPDETFAQNGCVFGASVGSDTIQIKGAYCNARSSYIRYDGANWVGTNAPYTYEWIAGGTALLRVTRTTTRSTFPTNGSIYPMVVPRRISSDALIHVAIDAVSKTSFDVRFYDAAGTMILVESTDLKFYVMDPVVQPTPFSWNTAPDTLTANVWMVGVFGRKPATY